MDHLREQIADAAVTALTGLTTTATRVYRGRDTDERPLQSDEVPGLVILTGGESPAIASLGVSRILERTMRLLVTAHAKAASGVDSTMNQILKECEVALSGASLGGAKSAHIAEVGDIEVSEGSDKPVASQLFVFEFFYVTAHGAPDVAL